MKLFYPVFAEEIYKIEKEIFKSDSSYETNETLRNAVHAAIVFVSKTAIEEHKEKCANLNSFEAIKKIADFYHINLFHGFPILFNMDDDIEGNFSTMLSKAIHEVCEDPYNVEEKPEKQIKILQSNRKQSWCYTITLNYNLGYYYYSIDYVDKPSDVKTQFNSYKEAKIFFDKNKLISWEKARSDYDKACSKWKEMVNNGEV